MKSLHKIEPNLLALYTNESFELIKTAIPHWVWENEHNPEREQNQTYIISPDFLTPIPIRSIFGWTIESFESAIIEVCRTIIETQHGDNCHFIISNPDFRTWYPSELSNLEKKLEAGSSGIIIPDWHDAFELEGILNRIGWRLQRVFPSELNEKPTDQ